MEPKPRTKEDVVECLVCCHHAYYSILLVTFKVDHRWAAPVLEYVCCSLPVLGLLLPVCLFSCLLFVLCQSVCFSIVYQCTFWLAFWLDVFQFGCRSVCVLDFFRPTCLPAGFVRLFVYLYIYSCLPLWWPSCLSGCLSVCMPFCLCLSVCQSTSTTRKTVGRRQTTIIHCNLLELRDD